MNESLLAAWTDPKSGFDSLIWHLEHHQPGELAAAKFQTAADDQKILSTMLHTKVALKFYG